MRRSARIHNSTASVLSDGGPENAKLGNRRPKGRINPNSGMMELDKSTQGADDWDFYRDEKNLGITSNGIDHTITPARLLTSVRMRWNPIRGLTPDRLSGYIDQWRLGFFRQAGMTWDLMEKRDYQIQIDAPKRKKAVTRHGWDVLTVENVPTGMDALAKEQQEFLKYFYDHVSVTDAIDPDNVGSMSLLLRQMMDAIGKYYAVHEIVWEPQNDGNLTARFIFCPVWWFEGTRGKLRFLESEFSVYGKDMYPAEWLVTCGQGVMEACSILYIFKAMPMKSWIAYLDKFGLPGIHAKTSAQYGSRDWNRAVEALQSFAQDYAAVTSREVEMTLLEANRSTGGSFGELIEKIDKAITQLWRGADLGTSSKANSVGASLQESEGEILENEDAKQLEERLGTAVSRHALAWKFGPDAPVLAYLKLRTAPKEATAIDIQVDQFLLASGVPLGVASTLERYNRPTPKDGGELLTPPPSPIDIAKAKGAGGEFPNTKEITPLAQAVRIDLTPVRSRLKAIMAIEDPKLFEGKLRMFLNSLDKLGEDIAKDPSSASELEKIISGAMADGIARGAKLLKKK